MTVNSQGHHHLDETWITTREEVRAIPPIKALIAANATISDGGLFMLVFRHSDDTALEYLGEIISAQLNKCNQGIDSWSSSNVKTWQCYPKLAGILDGFGLSLWARNKKSESCNMLQPWEFQALNLGALQTKQHSCITLERSWPSIKVTWHKHQNEGVHHESDAELQ